MSAQSVSTARSDPTPPAVDWSALYSQVQSQGQVPSPTSEAIDAQHAVFQAMYLDLGAVAGKIAAAGVAPGIVTIYADVLNVPAGARWLVSGTTLTIVARRIQTADALSIEIDYRADPNKAVLVFADEIDGNIGIVAAWTGPNGPTGATFSLTQAPARGGMQIVLRDGTPVEDALTFAQGMPTFPSAEFLNALSVEFIFASLLYDQQPTIALELFHFVQHWAGASNDLLGAYLRASSASALLSAQIGAKLNGAAFVPYLTPSVYVSLATAFAAQAKHYESDYMALSTQKVVDDNAIALAKTLLANQTYQSQYTQALLAQAKSNYDNAVAATDAASANFTTARRKMVSTQTDFTDKGIPEWERKEILAAVIGLVTAVVTFAVGIAGMLAGDEAAGATSAGAAIQSAEAIQGAAKAGTEIAKLAKDLADVMKQLKKIMEGLQTVFEFTKSIVEAANNIDNAQSAADKMKKIGDDTGGADLTATYQWQIFQGHADESMKDPIKQGVGYARELKLAIDDTAIYGQALAAAQVAAVKASQDYAAVKLQVVLATQQQKVLQDYVNALVVGEAPTIAMMQRFYQRYIDAKSSLFAAAEGYRASYFYWALQPSTIRPRIIDPVNSLETGLKNLTSIALDQESALERFSPPPQVMTAKRVVIEDPSVLAGLRHDGKAHWSVGLDDEAFADFDRVRLTRVRVWLEGAKSGDPRGSVLVSIHSAGNYLDRFGGLNFQFTSKPLRRDFQYRISPKEQDPDWYFDDGTFGYIEVDGAVDQEVAYAYFQPTPFGQWAVDLTVGKPQPDFSGVTKITMEFAGSLIGQGMNATATAKTRRSLPKSKK